jgi:PTS system nitrogen regulatory IIA component
MAFPHATVASVRGLVMAVGICRQPLLDYESLDGKPIRLIFMTAAGTSYQDYMFTLMTLLDARLKDEELRNKYLRAPDAEALCRILKRTIPRAGAVR